ncbi:ABC transporter ATP-binding protein [Streptomyces sp. NPDC101455]|uniref:ABC transporter ATP-binding protein n=1 Tax=Streptomyces sp. NPDC101455 TaxID=3366142 RepID=UPI003808A7FD
MPTPIHSDATRLTGLHLELREVTQEVRGAGRVLDDVSFEVEAGRLVVIAGSSGAGKTVLLQTLAGLQAPTSGDVLHDGAQPGPPGPEFGYVPQEDVIHRELPLRRTLEYAGLLRMPGGTVSARVTEVLDVLGLAQRADTPVRALSGGERKRACIAAELLTRPRVLFLDEPTSGLDPVTGAALPATLRGLAESGTTVVLTTHVLADLPRCDQVVFLSPGGAVAFVGAPDALLGAFGAETAEDVYAAVAEGKRAEGPAPVQRTERVSGPLAHGPARVGAVRQWALLTRRTTALLVHNRLSVAVFVGSPVMIVAMFAVLFRAGAFDPAAPDPGATAMIMFWIAFGAFFFGLTYGLMRSAPARTREAGASPAPV